MVYTYTVEYCAFIKKSEIMSFIGNWIELEIVVSEINQTQKDKCYIFSCMQKLDLKKINGKERKRCGGGLTGLEGLEGGKREQGAETMIKCNVYAYVKVTMKPICFLLDSFLSIFIKIYSLLGEFIVTIQNSLTLYIG
jgi:hypothetical protein